MKNFKYNWDEIQAYFDAGHTEKECRAKYGYSGTALFRARKNGTVDIGTRNLSIERFLVRSTTTDSHWLKKRLVKEGIMENVCAICGQLPVWNNKPLMMQLDHIDGNHFNNALINLRILCPNCHTQTDTWGTRKLKIVNNTAKKTRQ